VGLKLNGTHQNVDTIRKNTETLVNASMEVGLGINVEKSKYILLSPHQNAGQIRDIKIAKNVSVEMFGNDSDKPNLI
jgi:hypothetical protein